MTLNQMIVIVELVGFSITINLINANYPDAALPRRTDDKIFTITRFHSSRIVLRYVTI